MTTKQKVIDSEDYSVYPQCVRAKINQEYKISLAEVYDMVNSIRLCIPDAISSREDFPCPVASLGRRNSQKVAGMILKQEYPDLNSCYGAFGVKFAGLSQYAVWAIHNGAVPDAKIRILLSEYLKKALNELSNASENVLSFGHKSIFSSPNLLPFVDPGEHDDAELTSTPGMKVVWSPKKQSILSFRFFRNLTACR